MATYHCVPSPKTVPPCPSGTSPDALFVMSLEEPSIYAGNFDHIPVQDLMVGVSMCLTLLMGVMAGRK